MAKDNKIRMPTSQGGLTSYHESTGSRLQIKPVFIIVLAVIIMLFVILMHLFGGKLLGI